ncbi:hypothetical protein BD410DRAFT_900985 [Rickenella mellea]|uniref:Protein MON2 homolog n=1 Tax=Rickenella mellea TaxID=50990 RepID=A0A4Y7PTN3_9AGAM|nr:hypothetical protein BD410DRAFT_900985 [Rickenella mellea]
MSSLAFLVTELQSLASETRRKHPEVREAAEKSLAILRSSSEQATSRLASDGPQSQDLLRPFFMGCAIKNAKVVAISLGSLQRLIALQAVPQSLVPLIIKTMNDCVSQGVDIQLRILQTLLSLITNFPSVHGELLGDALILCFRLQESRIAVVSSTAAATLRQLVMFVVDKVLDEDRKESPDASQMADIQLPDGSKKSLAPSARDAFSVIEDLCLLANAERPHFLKLDSLPKTFALELIESVLTNYHELFRKHNELLALLQHHLCPLLLKTLSDRPIFPLTLRSTRVVFLLLKQFSIELITEAEVFLTLLIRTVGGEMDPATGAYSSENNPAHGARPHWMRVLAMEIIRGLCNDAELMRGVWNRYDAQNAGSKVFTSLITALKRLVTEKPALLGVSTQMFGIGVASNPSESSGLPASGSGGSGYGFDLGSVAGMVANAASATVSGVVGMMGTEHGLSVAGSAMKLQCIDQLDKADSPSIPESYIYLLGLQCLVSLCEGFASITLPLYNSIVIQKPRAAGDAVTRAPPALDLASLPADQPSTKQLQTVHDMVASGWPGLLAALSFIVATNLSDDLFADVLQSYQNMANVSGMLGLTTPRDAFLTSLAKFAIPSRVVSSLDSYIEPSTPRSASGVISENLGIAALGGATQQAPGLSERNMACLKVLASCALFLAGSLGSSWFDILEALQNADYVLNTKGSRSAAAKRSSFVPPTGQSPSRSVSQPAQGLGGAGVGPAQPRHNLLTDIDSDSVSRAIQRLFDSTKNLEDQAFKDFVAALCRLSSEMVDMQSDSNSIIIESQSEDSVQGGLLSPSIEASHRRRASGIHLPRTLRTGDFGINRLGNVALLNVHRLIYRPPDVAWNALTSHLVSVLRHPSAPHSIRLQAARALDEILVVVPRNITSTGDLQAEVQTRVLDVLSQQVAPDTVAGNTPTVVDIRRMGLETLHQILQSSGHTLVVGWETIFDMLGSVCEPSSTIPESLSLESTTSQSTGVSPRGKPLPLGYSNDRGNASLVRIAFQSLTLVCDSLSTLSPEHLRLCISTLGKFGRQRDTNIALTAAGSLLWGVSDSIQAKRRDETQEPAYSALWMFLLLEVLGLCTDSRAEVRVGAIQTLFRTLQLYGATLSLETWDECLWKVTFPLLDSISSVMRQMPAPTGTIASLTDQSSADYPSRSWDESKILALQSIGSIFGDFLVLKIMHLPSFEKVWDSFVQHVQESSLLDRPAVSTAALRCLEKGLRSSSTASADLADKVSVLWQRSWRACDDMGGAVLRRASAQAPETDSDDNGNFLPFDQESLLALVDVVQCTRSVSRAGKEGDWPLDRLTRLMVILKGVLTYPNSPIYRADIDALTPVQTAVMDAILTIDLSVPKSSSLVIRDLSEFATLPFIASFDVHDTDPNPNKRPQSRVTYIGLTKKVMPMLVELFLRFKDNVDLYVDETLEAILSAYSVPIKLKYDCPPPSKFGNDLPLWKTATSCFLRIIKESTAQLRVLGHSIPDERIEGIWRKVIDVFKAGILADCTAAEAFTLEEQEAEENFDLSLVASLEVDVVPLLGDPRVPDYLIMHLAKFLHQGSCIYDLSANGRGPFSPGQAHVKDSEEVVQTEEFIGSTANGQLLPRERFSYWCFDLLFLICSDAAKDQENHRRRVAALSLPSLLQRCRTTLLSYVADEAVRGNYPFPRAREEEVVYVLRKLLTLRLWTGSLWAALSESPSKHATEQPLTDLSLTQSSIISDATKRSDRAHLLHFYPVLCQIAALPRTTPTAWTTENKPHLPDDPSLGMVDARHSRVAFTAQNGVSVEYDIRDLGRSCLVEVGKALGIE